VICRECGRVVDLECEHGDSSCLRPPGDLGFTEIEAEIVFWGTCAVCHKQRLAEADNE
jgi:Fur family ferric uptake transcriptional regulator